MEVYKMEPHNMEGKICGKTYCVKCGLVSLNNQISKRMVFEIRLQLK